MSALDQIRASLDQLMGTGRDGENSKFQVRFDDARVCKSFLLGCCPHEILSSTRMDLGECPKIHDLALKADYEMASKTRDYFYDIDAMEHLSNFIGDCDKRTEIAKRKLKETQEELSEEATQKAERIHILGEQMGTTLAKAEEMGAQGDVDESLKLMREVEELKKEKAQAEVEYRNSMPASSYQQQKLRVCEVCSAYLGIHDNDRRLADHFGGKLHLGFISIREKLYELKNKVEEDQTTRRVQRETEREERRQEREQEEAARLLERQMRERKREEEREERKREEEARRRSREREEGARRKRRSRSRSSTRRKVRRRSRSGERRRRHRSGSGTRSHRRRSRSPGGHRGGRRHSRSGTPADAVLIQGSPEPPHAEDTSSRASRDENGYSGFASTFTAAGFNAVAPENM